MNSTSKFKVLIVGAGSAGISVAARLSKSVRKSGRPLIITVVDPSPVHYYQPMWTLVGAGVTSKESTLRRMQAVIPSGVQWIQDRVESFQPETNRVLLEGGGTLEYDFMVLAPGIQLDWNKIQGLDGQLGKNGICSNYSYDTVDSTWRMLRDFEAGHAVFTQPNTPVKCGGAPQKIAYLAEDFLTRKGLRSQAQFSFYCGNPAIFSVKKYADSLLEVIKRKKIQTFFRHNLVAVDAENKRASFEDLSGGTKVDVHYDLLHVTPPMSAPDFIKKSPFADAAGWVDVDKESLRHKRFQNVFGLGDASSLPTSKTAAAIRKQAPVVVENLSSLIRGQEMKARYDGYTSCPLVTSYDKVILAEFNYNLEPCESFPFDQSKERRSMYLLKRYMLPQIYWKGMLRGNL